MAASFDLGRAYLAAHPADAARVLEALPTHEASTLFLAVEPNLAAPVAAAMLPTAAARILSDLPESAAIALAAGTSAPALAAILRHVAPELRSRLIAALPAPAAVAARMLLGFPEDSVGAWTDTGLVTVPAAASAATALDEVRAAPDSTLDQVYVVDAERRLAGCIGIHALLRADPRALAGSLARPTTATLSAMMTMTAARASTHWDRAQALPVLDRDQRLIGVLRRAALARALRPRSRGTDAGSGADSVTGVLAVSYWGLLSGISAAALSLLPAVKRVLPEDA